MELSDTVRMSDIKNLDMPKEMRPIIEAIVSAFDVHVQELVSQLRTAPTIYNVDPSKNPDIVEGAKAGDVAIWLDDTGTTQIHVFS